MTPALPGATFYKGSTPLMESHPPAPKPPAASAPPVWQRLAGAWDRFWFAKGDPTTLGLIRICTGLVMAYTMIVFTVDLQELLGRDAWLDLETRDSWRHEMPTARPALGWVGELPPPQNDEQRRYLEDYTRKYNNPPPAYPRTAEEAVEIEAYITRWGVDPRAVEFRGRPAWSIWFHVTDPGAMLAVQWGIVVVTILFALGCATRLTAALTWAASLSYMHRTPVCLFGVDWMAAILLLYLMIGPSGAALSVDRLIARWWATARVDVIGRWRAFWARGGAAPAPVLPGTWSPLPEQSVGANLAVRLLQVHVCIIYLMAGLSKLQGQGWWTGEAVWYTVANFEFAPMQSPLYLGFLKMLAANRVVFSIVFTTAAVLTLGFEISYAYLIWKRSTRPWLLAMAVMLHGSIGAFMGLKTFSLLMLTMNLAFVAPETVRWALRKMSGGRYGREGAAPPAPPAEKPPAEKPPAVKAEKPAKHFAGTVIKRTKR
jgi:hypothetical protein